MGCVFTGFHRKRIFFSNPVYRLLFFYSTSYYISLCRIFVCICMHLCMWALTWLGMEIYFYMYGCCVNFIFFSFSLAFCWLYFVSLLLLYDHICSMHVKDFFSEKSSLHKKFDEMLWFGILLPYSYEKKSILCLLMIVLIFLWKTLRTTFHRSVHPYLLAKSRIWKIVKRNRFPHV